MDVKCPDCNGTGSAGIPDFEGDKEVVTMHTCLTCMGQKKIYLEEGVLKAIKKFTAAKGGPKKKASFIQAIFTKLSRQATGRELRALRERDLLHRVISAMDDYIQALGDENGKLVVMMSSRGWKSTGIKEGKRARDEITQLRAEAGIAPMPEKGTK